MAKISLHVPHGCSEKGWLTSLKAAGITVFPNFSIAQNMAISRSLKDGGYKGAMGLFHEVDEQRTAENQRELLALKCHSVNQNITKLSGEISRKS